MTVSILLTVTGPAEIGRQYEAALAWAERRGLDFEFVFLVASADEATLRAIEARFRAHPKRTRVLQFAAAQGEAAMLAAGVDAAHGQVLVTLRPAVYAREPDLERVYAAVEAGADLAFASRPNQGIVRVQSRFFNRLLSFATGSRFSDVASGLRVMRREVLAETPLFGDLHRYLPVLAERLGFRVEEVPIALPAERPATAFHRPVTYLWRALDLLTVFFISRFTRRPLRLFAGVGTVFGGVGAAVLAVAVVQRLAGTPLADRPVLVLGTLLLGLGVQMVTIGLLAELILFFQARHLRDYRVAERIQGEPFGRPPASQDPS